MRSSQRSKRESEGRAKSGRFPIMTALSSPARVFSFSYLTSCHADRESLLLRIKFVDFSRERLILFQLVHGFVLRKAKLVQQPMEITSADAKFAGGFQPIARMHPQCRSNQFLLERLHRLMERTHALCWTFGSTHILELFRQIIDPEVIISTCQNHTAFNDVLQLANIAGPGVPGQSTQVTRRESDRRFPVSPGEGPQEMFRERRNIVLSVAQRRHLNLHHRNPKIKVLAKCTFLDHLFQ